jgi:hypothetical protein
MLKLDEEVQPMRVVCEECHGAINPQIADYNQHDCQNETRNPFLQIAHGRVPKCSARVDTNNHNLGSSIVGGDERSEFPMRRKGGEFSNGSAALTQAVIEAPVSLVSLRASPA